MKYYSTNNRQHTVSLEKAVKNGLAPDRGLYMPERFNVLPRNIFEKVKRSTSLKETAAYIAQTMFEDDLEPAIIDQIVSEALDFDTPVKEVCEGIYALELFHGPTLAFKDVGARFMAQLLNHYSRNHDQTVHVLVATSGDTGSAVANGFLGMEGIRVHVLYPSGQVSELQEKQFTTLGQNISALEVNGTFDDCQRLVKEAFADESLRSKMVLTSANSINLARLLPQAFYYFRGWSQIETDNLIFSVPSGNYGNLTAGLIAREMGLPVHTFLAASNANDIVPEYLKTGIYVPRSSVKTIANAMDVGAPSNFDRILDLFGHQYGRITQHIKGYSYSDDQIRQIISEVYKSYGYTPDPHGATAFEAAREYRGNHPGETVIFLETAHPAKFPEVVNALTDHTLEVPDRLKNFINGEKESISMGNDYQGFRDYILQSGSK